MRVRNITSKLILLIFLSGILLVQSLATLSAQNYDYSLKITSSENDAYEQDGQMFIDSPIVAMGKEDGIYRGGYRFKLNVPQGAHIDSAKLSLAYNWESGRYTSIILYGENVGNSRAFSNTLKDISSRQLTKANVTWINLARVKWGGYIVSPNITSIVQEIVNRPDWSAGNYITILAYEKSNTADVWEAVSYDGESANSATLKVKATSSTSPIVCGNSIIETGEVCDSNLKNCTLKSYLGTQSCNSQCNGFNSCQTTQSCGDGVKNGNEICDNGTKNGQPGYCNSLCTGITPIIPPQPVCGNNIIEGNETCDGTNLNGKTCSTLGFTGGTLSCSLCKFNTSKCANPPTQICGNGIKEGNEICDSNLKNCTINSYSGTQACNSLCTGFNSCQTTQSCGDGIKNGNEICDDGNTKNGDGCSSTCKTETPTNQTNISKIILLQMDDCQAWWLRDTCASIVSLHIRKKADINLGFIPYELTQDVAWKIILQNWTNNYPGIIQIGQHSYDHSSQYIGWTVPQIVADMKKGQVEFAKWDIVPKSFVPAYGWSKNVANASNLAGYKVVFNGLDNSYAQGSIGDTMILSDGLYCGDGTKSCVNQDYSLLKSSVDERIVAKGYAIIVFHQQDFGTVGSSQYNTLYNKWSSNIDKFKVDKYTFMTVDEYYNYKKGL